MTHLGVASVLLAAALVPAPASVHARAACEPGAVATEVPWAQKMLAPDRVWPFSAGGGVTVAVIDSAVDATHPQLKTARIRQPGLDYLGPPSTGCVSHGTAVASLIAARGVDGVGFRGLARDAQVLPVRVSDHSRGDDLPAVDTATFARAIVESAAQAKVINISLTLPQDDPFVRAAIQQVIAQDVVVVAAVGNGHTASDGTVVDPPSYPAAYPGVVGVGAITRTGERLPQSQVGTYVDIVAPGGEVLAATPLAGHAVVNGTSFATPFVAATAALVRAARPTLNASGVVTRLLATATPSRGGPDSLGYGAGIVNPYRAVTELLMDNDQAAVPSAPARQVDAAAVARTQAWQRMGSAALTTAGVTAALLMVVVLTGTVYRRGHRRRWRAGRARVPVGPPPTEDI